jgi:hypothetical protein
VEVFLRRQRYEQQAIGKRASAAMAKALRAAGATMSDRDLVAVAELHIRLATSLAQVSTHVLDTSTWRTWCTDPRPFGMAAQLGGSTQPSTNLTVS